VPSCEPRVHCSGGVPSIWPKPRKSEWLLFAGSRLWRGYSSHPRQRGRASNCPGGRRRGVHRRERWRTRRSTSEAAKAEAVRTGDVFAKRTQSIELFRSLPSARNRKARKLPPASRSLSPLASVSALMDLDKKDAKSSELTIFSGFHCRHNPGCRSPAFAGAVRPAASHPLVHGRLNVCLKIVGMPASRVSACFEHCGPATATLRRKKAPAANLPP
jgi:hypothetical protein